jgi:ABC-2 type transport system permease protein
MSVIVDIPGRVLGPSALGGGVRRFLTLSWTLAVLEFKLRFFGSALGYLWQLVRPLMLFGVLYLVFTKAFALGRDIKFYPAILLTGIVLYTFFADATSSAVSSVLDRENIVRKVHFPRLAIPLATVLTASLTLLLNLLAVAVFAVALIGVPPRWTWLEFPFLLALLAVYAFGIAMLVSALFVRHRDVRPIWDVLLQVIFYASPVLYVVERIDVDWIRTLMMNFNPLAPVLQQVRHAVIDEDAPSAAAVMGGPVHLLVPLAVIVAVVAVGGYVFAREAPRIAEDL